jgi:predicted DNA-binding transcriptional regulator AlpA
MSEVTSRLIPLREACARLGGVTIRTVERWHEDDPTFPRFHKLGGRNFLLEHELEAYIARLPKGIVHGGNDGIREAHKRRHQPKVDAAE